MIVFRIRRRVKRIKPQVLVLIDWENIILNIQTSDVENFSLRDGFDKLIHWLTRFGAVMNVFVFSPPQAILAQLGLIHQLGFYFIGCPKVKGKGDKDVDTVDSTLMRFAREMILTVPTLTHLCLCSGDADFAPILVGARKAGLEIAVCSGDYHSLSHEIIRLISKDPEGKKMFHLFSPVKELDEAAGRR